MRRALPVTPAEFKILEVLWREPEAVPVSRVLEILKQQREIAYTTVMTLLDTMARKGSVRRRKQGKAYFYQPSASRDRVLGDVVNDFASRYFGGMKKLGTFLSSSNRKSKRVAKPDADTPEMDVILL